MAGERLNITFDDLGLATVLQRYQLVVPPNQRSYAWEKDHVQTLLEDFSIAKARDVPTYFLGSIVLTHGVGNTFEVADGQQRLATTAILISAIRDYLYDLGESGVKAADRYTSDFLLTYDPLTDENTPKLRLNTIDADIFLRAILPAPNDPIRTSEPVLNASSHERLLDALELASKHVENIVAQYPRNQHSQILIGWIEFLRRDAIVIVIEVPDHIDAYQMFETLNDRGLRASQIDILKNDLMNRAGDREHEVEGYWNLMVGTIESIGDDYLILDCVRHHWISMNGPTTEAELAKSVKEKTTSRQNIVDYVTSLQRVSGDYVALLNPLHHPRWTGFDLEARGHLAVLTNVLGIAQIRPLLLAVIKQFSPSDAKEAFRLFVSWSVRFLVAGGGGGGVLDRHYGMRAKEITDGVITTCAQLTEKMQGIVRSDEVFETAFRTHSVSRNVLARYYLRALELCKSNDSAPSLGGVDNTTEFNLEHIIPQNPSEQWNISEADARNYYKRIGNMVLLSPTQNVAIGNRVFPDRRGVYQQCPLLLTQEVGEYNTWGPDQIEERQIVLAEYAVKTWRL